MLSIWLILHLAAWLLIAGTGCIILRLGISFRSNSRAVAHVPGQKLLIHPHHILSMILPKIPYINLTAQYAWQLKKSIYDDERNICSTVSVIPPARTICVSNAEAIKFIVKERRKFMKPTAIYAALGMFGPNVGITEEADWTRHRRIVTGPFFQETTSQRAWDETIRVMELCLEEWQSKTVVSNGHRNVHIPSGVSLTLKSIAGAAFSQYPPWNDDAAISMPKNHRMTFRHALHMCLENVFWKIAVPDVILRNTRLKPIKDAYDELRLYFQEMISDRREKMSDARTNDSGKADLLGSLVAASANPDEKSEFEDEEPLDASRRRAKLNDDEGIPATDRILKLKWLVMGNIYIFLLAGHDTTAHTLAFSLALLALYPDIQQKAYEHIQWSLDGRTEPTFSDFPRLTYILAVFLETLRLYPSVVVIPKYAMEDVIVPLRSWKNGKPVTDSILIPEGGEVFLNAVGLHYDEHFWPDPSAFMPERFIDTLEYQWPREAFLGFSAGPRSCLGQKYAQIEAVAILTTILRKYEVLLQEDVDGTAPKGETLEAKRERITKCKTVITLTPDKIPFCLRERP